MHEDEHAGDFWTEVWSITLDPAHMVAELISAVIIDVIVVALIYNFVFKRLIIPKVKYKLAKEIHAEIDTEHGYTHQHSDKENK